MAGEKYRCPLLSRNNSSCPCLCHSLPPARNSCSSAILLLFFLFLTAHWSLRTSVLTVSCLPASPKGRLAHNSFWSVFWGWTLESLVLVVERSFGNRKRNSDKRNAVAEVQWAKLKERSMFGPLPSAMRFLFAVSFVMHLLACALLFLCLSVFLDLH